MAAICPSLFHALCTPLGVLPPESPLPVPETRSAFIGVHNETLSVGAMCVCNPDHSALCQVTLGLRSFFRVCFSPGYDLALAPRASTIFEPSGAVQK